MTAKQRGPLARSDTSNQHEGSGLPDSSSAGRVRPSPRELGFSLNGRLAGCVLAILVTVGPISSWLLQSGEGRPSPSTALAWIPWAENPRIQAVRTAPHRAGGWGLSVELAKHNLRADRVSPHRWAELALLYAAKGDLDASRFCFDQSVRYGPALPSVLVAAANGASLLGDYTKAMALAADALRAVRTYDAVIFGYYEKSGLGIGEVLRHGVPPEPGPARAYLQYLLDRGSTRRADAVWDWMRGKSLAADYSLRNYVGALIEEGRYLRAAEAMAHYRPGEGRWRQTGSLVFNPGFELEPTSAALDWRWTKVPTVRVQRDHKHVWEGAHSLRIELEQAAGEGFQALVQRVVTPPGRYRFRAWARAVDLTPGEKLCFRVFDRVGRSAVRTRSTSVRADGGWHPLTAEFVVHGGVTLVDVQLARCTPLKIRSEISGSVWIDEVTLTLAEETPKDKGPPRT